MLSQNDDVFLIKNYIGWLLVSALCGNKIIKTNKEGSSNKNVYFRNVVAGAK